MGFVEKYQWVVDQTEPIKWIGKIRKIQGLLIESRGPQAVIGELCHIDIPKTNKTVAAEVVGIEENTVQLMPFEPLEGIERGCEVTASGETLQIAVSDQMLGRSINALGQPVDGKGGFAATDRRPVMNQPPDAIQRQKITRRMVTGVRVIDGLIPPGQGQRMGIFAGSGVGKSTLLGMIARNTEADVNVIALIGERGREVREFMENDLGEEGLRKSVVVVATSDTPPLNRLRAAFTAITVAEYFRSQGKNVMMLFDSVTRFAMAQREIGLATGEPPATRGYTPSVFALLPRLLERCGTAEKGSITGFFTILVEGDDMDEPVSDAVRGILDGHIVLQRELAHRYHYPAVDVLGSISRLAPKITTKNLQAMMGYIRKIMAVYKEAEDLINVGAYVQGSNAEIDEAVERIQDINRFLQQEVEERNTLKETLLKLSEISRKELTQEDYEHEKISL